MIALDSLPRNNRIALIGQILGLDLTESDHRMWLFYNGDWKVGNEYNPYVIHQQSEQLFKWLVSRGDVEFTHIPNSDRIRCNYRYMPEKFKNIVKNRVLVSLVRDNVKHIIADMFICVNFPLLRMEKNYGQETLT